MCRLNCSYNNRNEVWSRHHRHCLCCATCPADHAACTATSPPNVANSRVASTSCISRHVKDASRRDRLHAKFEPATAPRRVPPLKRRKQNLALARLSASRAGLPRAARPCASGPISRSSGVRRAPKESKTKFTFARLSASRVGLPRTAIQNCAPRRVRAGS